MHFRLKEIHDRYNLRMAFTKHMEICNVKKLWLTVKGLEEKIKKIEKDMDQAKHSAKKAQLEFNKSQSEYNELKKNRDKVVAGIELKVWFVSIF